mmetsp:Transcript_30714/g.92892  ORF Transcript_30714/g.92892 Transcript_30714/m.92892 type:complete len:271 (-) Transcript_30714:330-1142(-)
MWVAGHAVAIDLLAEVHDLLQRQALLQVSSRVRARRGVALHVNLIAHAAGERLAPEKMVLADLDHVAHRGEGADVAADARGALVAVAHHDRGVPADEVGEPALHGQVAWVLRLAARGDGVDHGREDRLGHLHALPDGLVHELVDQEARLQRAMVLDHCIEGLDPLRGFFFVVNGQVRLQGDEGRRVVAPVLVHECQRGRELGHVAAQRLRELRVGDVTRLVLIKIIEESLRFRLAQRQANLAHEARELLNLQVLAPVTIRPCEPLVGELV